MRSKRIYASSSRKLHLGREQTRGMKGAGGGGRGAGGGGKETYPLFLSPFDLPFVVLLIQLRLNMLCMQEYIFTEATLKIPIN